MEYGYSVTEELWYRIERGKWAGKVGLRGLKTREPFFYNFFIHIIKILLINCDTYIFYQK